MSGEDAVHDDPRPPPRRVDSGARSWFHRRARCRRRDPRRLVLLGALLLPGVLRTAGRRRARAGWSAWKPTKDGPPGAAQIAAARRPAYRGPDGRQLVLVKGGALEVSGLPLTVAVRDPGSAGGAITTSDGKGVLYRLCGPGRGCAVAPGKPSIERHLLLRREALELALYSLRYLDDVDDVVVFMPPRTGDQPSQALFFRKDRMRGEIEKPLDATLVDRTPTVARVTRSPDALLVEQLTIPALFRFTLTPADQDDRTFLVLDPLDAHGPCSPTMAAGVGTRERRGAHPRPGASGDGSRGVKPGQAATGTRGYFG